MTALVAVVLAAHVLCAAVWFGAMAYSLGVVQPRIERALGDRSEPMLVVLAAGARWKVAGLIGVLALTGAALALLPTHRSAVWWAAIVVSVLALVGAAAVFWAVSWRMWPARVFAMPDELPAHRRRFRVVAWTMATLTGVATVAGVVAHVVT
jgi:hypothetical protein